MPRRKVVHSEAYLASLVNDCEAIEPFSITLSTRKSMENVGRIWNEYRGQCAQYGHRDLAWAKDPRSALETLDNARIRAFMKWYLDSHNIKQVDALYVMIRYFRMYWRHTLWRDFPPTIKSATKHYISTTLAREYELSEAKEDKLLITSEDLIILLHHFWSHDSGYFHTGRERVQFALILLLMAYTSARPSTLLTTKDYKDHDAALRWRDIEMHLIRDPAAPKRTSIIIKIKLRLYKGRRGAGVAPVFVFYERHDSFALCPVLHVLALAFAAGAIASNATPETYADVSASTDGGLQMYWKPEFYDRPVFQTSRKGEHGWEIPVDASPIDDTDVRDHTRALVRDAGFPQRVTLYAFRRGAGQAINKCASRAELKHILGHVDDKTFEQNYVSQIVGVDTVAAYLKKPSPTELFAKAQQLNLRRDPHAKAEVNKRVTATDFTAGDERLDGLTSETERCRREVLTLYTGIGAARGTEIHKTYKGLQRQVYARRAALRRACEQGTWEDYFRNNSTDEINRQLAGGAPRQLPSPPQLTGERSILANVLFLNVNADEEPEDDLRAYRQRALTNMISLCPR